MGFFCPVCNEEWLIYNTLCTDCRKIKHTMNLVGKERFNNAIERLFVISNEKTNKLFDKEEQKPGVITRLALKKNST